MSKKNKTVTWALRIKDTGKLARLFEEDRGYNTNYILSHDEDSPIWETTSYSEANYVRLYKYRDPLQMPLVSDDYNPEHFWKPDDLEVVKVERTYEVTAPENPDPTDDELIDWVIDSKTIHHGEFKERAQRCKDGDLVFQLFAMTPMSYKHLIDEYEEDLTKPNNKKEAL